MISKRIRAISSYIDDAKTIADIGTDHGYLLIEALNNYNITKAYAIDNKELPLQRAKDNLIKYPFYDKIEFVLSNGLTNLSKEVDAIILAGMGGILIKNILEDGIKNHPNAKLIIQANRNNYDLREYLMDESYEIINEEVIKEVKKFYEIIVAKKISVKIKYSYADLLFGPILRKERSNIFILKLNNDLRILNNIHYKTDEINGLIKIIKEELNEN